MFFCWWYSDSVKTRNVWPQYGSRYRYKSVKIRNGNKIDKETYCAIWYHLYNVKNVKNTHEGMLLLVKLQSKTCNFLKSSTPPWVFLTNFKLCKWYKIEQNNVKNIHEGVLLLLYHDLFSWFLNCTNVTKLRKT